MTARAVITKDRAARIARAHACERCGEYSYKRLGIKVPTPSQRNELKEAWHAVMVCGVCNLEQEMGIAADGEVIYVS